MHRQHFVRLLLGCVLLTACADQGTQSNALKEAVAVAVTSTSAGAGRDCQLDDLLGSLFLLEADATVYASGYSDERFCGLRKGMSQVEVETRLGPPLAEIWDYGDESPEGWFWIESGKVSRLSSESSADFIGMSVSEVQRRHGAPRQLTMVYTLRSSGTNYRVRNVEIVDGRVAGFSAGVYVD